MHKKLQVPNIQGAMLDVWTLDFETFYDSKEKYSLSNKKSTTVQYIRDPRFKAHGCAVIEPDGNSYWVTHHELEDFFNDRDWSQIAWLSHNTAFDGFIAHEQYGVQCGYYLDTLSMARGLWGPGVKNGLEYVSKRLGRAGKIKGELEKTDGIRDLLQDQEAALIPYALQDVAECRGIFEAMYFDMGFPDDEMHIIDITLKAFVLPKLQVDAGLCRAEILEEDIRMQRLLSSDLLKEVELSADCKAKLVSGGIEGLMRSRPCFAEMLLSRGVHPPMKQRMKNGEPVPGEMTYAFAKNDIELIALADDERVSDLVAAWTGSKSTLRKTRAQRLLDVTEEGTKLLPIPLNYCGGRTHRWSGGGGDEGVYNPYNPQNLSSGRDGRGSRLREAIIAPKGFRVVGVDSAQVECFCGSVRILTRDRGYVPITEITTDDKLWDGYEWVDHDGVVFKGYKEVIEYAGIRATPDHRVYLATGGTLSLIEAKMENAELLVGERDGQIVWSLDHFKTSKLNDNKELDVLYEKDVCPVYDILNAGPRNRFTAEGKIVSNCRFTAWLGGETELLEDFALGRDPYSKLASEIFGVHVTKDNQYKHLRHVGKEGELSLGFGVGWRKFFNTIQTKYGLDTSQFSEEDAQKTVSFYRQKREGIVKLWKTIDEHLVHMAAKTCGKGRPFKVVSFKNDKIIMPNGLPIQYTNFHWAYDPEKRQGNYVYQFRDEWVKIYASKCLENIVQSIARTAVAQQAINIAKELPIVLLVHDEVVALAPEKEADDAVRFMVSEMSKAPAWCSDIPLAAEGKHSKCYMK